jgi:hypothetical protein
MGRRGGSFARALLLARKVNFLFFPFFTFFCFFTFFIVVNLSCGPLDSIRLVKSNYKMTIQLYRRVMDAPIDVPQSIA